MKQDAYTGLIYEWRNSRLRILEQIGSYPVTIELYPDIVIMSARGPRSGILVPGYNANKWFWGDVNANNIAFVPKAANVTGPFCFVKNPEVAAVGSILEDMGDSCFATMLKNIAHKLAFYEAPCREDAPLSSWFKIWYKQLPGSVPLITNTPSYVESVLNDNYYKIPVKLVGEPPYLKLHIETKNSYSIIRCSSYTEALEYKGQLYKYDWTLPNQPDDSINALKSLVNET